MLNVILVLHSLIAVALIGVVLLQKSEGGALGIGGGGGGFMSIRGTANLLTRTTAGLAAAFFATSITLAIYAGTHRAPSSIVDRPAPATESQPAAPAQPTVPRSQ
ncbi:preprotein translocase subunit SecG [Desertibaculum subflavum]|uniref:preprotein translocase subunit SecG n=1 Tax=Desertibaculum subflavum TaxID=2268458 RepID=UPI000E661DC8